MQIIVAFLVVIGSSVTYAFTLLPDEKEFGDEIVKQCITETSISKSLLEMDVNDKNRDQMGSFALCISKKVGYQDDDGNLQSDMIKESLTNSLGNTDQVNTVMRKCFVKKSTAEETALTSLQCFGEEISTN